MTEKLSELLRSQNTIPLSAPDTTKGDKADKEIVDRLKMELQKFKQDTKGSNDSLSSAVKELEEKMKTANKYLPPLVKSTRHQLLQQEQQSSDLPAPACMWKNDLRVALLFSKLHLLKRARTRRCHAQSANCQRSSKGGQVC